MMYEITFIDVGNHFKEKTDSTAILERAFPRVGWRMTKGNTRSKGAFHVGEDPLSWGIVMAKTENQSPHATTTAMW